MQENKKTIERKCCSCQQIKNRDDLIKITADYKTKKLVINPDNFTFGRSIYICPDKSCVEKAFKKTTFLRFLKNKVDKNAKNELEKIRAVLESIIVLKI